MTGHRPLPTSLLPPVPAPAKAPTPAPLLKGPAPRAAHPVGDHDDDHNHHGHARDADLPHADNALLSARSITLTKSGRRILDHVDLELMPGEIVTLIGPNGAGKTSLVRVLLGVEATTEGSVQRPA
jgi:ABC-type molybdenum transport system ATPase subunit/photorepair protein PhrA